MCALPLISAPTLVLHPTRDRAIPIAIARYTAARIPGAVLKELDTADHLIWFSEAVEAITDEIQTSPAGPFPPMRFIVCCPPSWPSIPTKRT